MIKNLKILGVAVPGQRCIMGDNWLINLDTTKFFSMNTQGKFVFDRQIGDRDLWTDPTKGDTYQNQRGRLLLVLMHSENFLSLCPSRTEMRNWAEPQRRACI